jgi:hypothetical protein
VVGGTASKLAGYTRNKGIHGEKKPAAWEGAAGVARNWERSVV